MELLGVLQKHVMTFVNQIAEIVHGVADDYRALIFNLTAPS